MHYIDIYIKIKGYPIDINNTMKDVNPIDFTMEIQVIIMFIIIVI